MRVQLSNSTLKYNHKINGFTLVELLISLGVFGIVGSIVISILFATLRVSKKSDVTIAIKHNGNSAIAQVSKQIRYAKILNIPSSCVSPVTTSSVTITSLLDNAQTEYLCTSGVNATIASNGASLIDTTNVYVSNCSFSCSQATLNDPPTIGFSFVLTSKNPNNVIEERVSIPFRSSVILKNYNQ